MNVEMVFPEGAFGSNAHPNSLTEALRELTVLLSQVTGAELGGGLGGDDGYGDNFENATFLMHRYCWCERNDCPWCAGCWCEDNNWRDPSQATSPKGEQCAWCRGVNQWPDKGALSPAEPPHQGAPNFWHKPTGIRVWWYKWIGRGMEVVGGNEDEARAAVYAAALSVKPDGDCSHS